MLRACTACFVIVVCLCAITQVYSQPTASVPNNVTDLWTVKLVVVPACGSSHWFQSLAIIKELSHRGHSIQVSRQTDRVVQLPELCIYSSLHCAFAELLASAQRLAMDSRTSE